MNFFVLYQVYVISKKFFFDILNVHNNVKLNRFVPETYCLMDQKHTESWLWNYL